MTTDLLFKNFHLLADTPGGVKKLRQLILQLAVQGRLVPQNPDDEPASVLLQQIKAEKQRLIKEGKIKKQKPLPEIRPDEVPYELPKGWEWSNIQSLYCQYPISNQQKIKVKNYYESGKIPIVDQGKELIGGHTNEEEKVIKIFPVIIFGDHTRITKYIDFPFVPGADGIKVLLPVIIYEKYLYHLINSIDLPTRGYARHYRLLKEKIVPVPPLPEQHRIVAKVDQLMTLCDELEARQEKQKAAHARLNKSALHALTQSRTRDELTFNWTRLKDNFSLVFTTPESIQELRSSILQLAVQGRLVPQNPDDEPASVLLEKIREEKQRLIKEGIIKKQKPLPEIRPDEMPYDVPQGWEWVRLSDMLLKLTDGTHHSPTNTEQGEYKYVTAKNIKNFGIDLNGITFVSREVHRSIFSRCNPEFGDILYIKDGATTGVATINSLREPFSMLSSVALLKVPSHIINKYLLIVLRSPFFFDSMREDMSGVAITRVTLSKMSVAHVPIPPLPEQHRIVAKVDQLMALCDELESSLTRSQADGQKLMQSVVVGLSQKRAPLHYDEIFFSEEWIDYQ